MGHRSTCACFNAPVLAVAPLLCHIAECIDNERHVVGRFALIAFAMAADHALAKVHPTTRLAHPSFTGLRIGLVHTCLPNIHAPYAFYALAAVAAAYAIKVVRV
jgi:hypothetical protein